MLLPWGKYLQFEEGYINDENLSEVQAKIAGSKVGLLVAVSQYSKG